MLKRLKTSVIIVAATLNVVAIVLMLVFGYGGALNPAAHPTLATLTLAFPAALLLNLGCLVFWVFVRWRWAWLPVVGLLACASPVRKYLPVNVGGSPPDDAIKVLSYNIANFSEGTSDYPQAATEVMDYLYHSDADIICLQEANEGSTHNRMSDTLAARYPYHQVTVKPGNGETLQLFSRFPVRRTQVIDYPSEGNMSVAYLLDIGGTPTVVVNNHLETNSLSLDDRANFKEMVQGDLPGSAAKAEGRMLFGKVAAASSKRAPQAGAVHRFVEQQRAKGRAIIVCGDFNDNPLSYSVRTIGQNLTDCYVTTGNGPGWSYHKNGMFVRIDHLLCSDDWEAYGAQVDAKIAASDHYPIYCWLKKRLKR